MIKMEIKENATSRIKIKIITLDAVKVPDFETYKRLLESGELNKYIISEEVSEE